MNRILKKSSFCKGCTLCTALRLLSFVFSVIVPTPISSMDDIQKLFKETIAEFMENGLNVKLDDELGCSKYDYKNKDTDNNQNGHSSKILRTNFGDVEVSIPRDRKGKFEPQIQKKNQANIGMFFLRIPESTADISSPKMV